MAELNYDCSILNVNDYVVVKFLAKTKTIHYIGQIIEEDNEQMIKYLKRENSKCDKFVCVSDELFELPRDDIVCKLSKPVQHGGTARVSRHLIFDADLSIFSNLS